MEYAPLRTAVAAAAVFALLILYTLAVSVRASIRAAGRMGIRRLHDKTGHVGRVFLSRCEREPTAVFSTLTIVIQLTVIALALLSVAYFSRPFGAYGVGAVLSGVCASLVLLSAFLPQFVAARDPDRILLKLLPFAGLILLPFLVVVSPVSRAFARGMARPGEEPTRRPDESVDDEIDAFLEVGEEAGILDQGDRRMVISVVDFGDMVVREVMTPRIDIVCIEAGETIRALCDLVIETKFTRIPVYRGRIDNVVGIAHAKDVLPYWKSGKDNEPVSSIMRSVNFVPETARLTRILAEFQKNRVHMSIVIDEYGGTAGLVTVEDLIEVIVGEIQDEYDEETSEVLRREGSAYLLSGKAGLENLEELFGLAVENESYETVSGLLLSILGRLPTPGEQVAYKQLLFTVKDADHRRILKVLVERAAEPPPATDAGHQEGGD